MLIWLILVYPFLATGKYGNNEMNKKLKVKKQMLCSYSLTFRFKTDSGILDNLNGKKFELNKSPFSISFFSK